MSDIAKYKPELNPDLSGDYRSLSVALSNQSTVTLTFDGTPFGATDYTGYVAVIGTQVKLIASNTSSDIVTTEAFSGLTVGQSYELGLYEESYTAYRPNMGHPPNGIKPAHFCYICAHAYREEELIFFEGRWYCVPNDCYKVAGNIKYRRKARQWRPNTKDEPGSLPFVVQVMD